MLYLNILCRKVSLRIFTRLNLYSLCFLGGNKMALIRFGSRTLPIEKLFNFQSELRHMATNCIVSKGNFKENSCRVSLISAKLARTLDKSYQETQPLQLPNEFGVTNRRAISSFHSTSRLDGDKQLEFMCGELPTLLHFPIHGGE